MEAISECYDSLKKKEDKQLVFDNYVKPMRALQQYLEPTGGEKIIKNGRVCGVKPTYFRQIQFAKSVPYQQLK